MIPLIFPKVFQSSGFLNHQQLWCQNLTSSRGKWLLSVWAPSPSTRTGRVLWTVTEMWCWNGFFAATPPKTHHVPWKSMVGRCISYWNSPVFRGHVSFQGCTPQKFKSSPLKAMIVGRRSFYLVSFWDFAYFQGLFVKFPGCNIWVRFVSAFVWQTTWANVTLLQWTNPREGDKLYSGMSRICLILVWVNDHNSDLLTFSWRIKHCKRLQLFYLFSLWSLQCSVRICWLLPKWNRRVKVIIFLWSQY